ncbi:MAG: GNAT family N-acetyltransferase [Deltaproteobacteria bacterium]
MPDLLVKLYGRDFPQTGIPGVTIRRPMPHERGTVRRWVARTFGEGWGDEFACSFKSFPVTSFIALRDDAVVGFATYDATFRGFFGPTGVLESERGKGIGKELLVRSMIGLRELGYAYAIIGAAGPTDFYEKMLGAIPIPGSTPGIYPARKIRE